MNYSILKADLRKDRENIVDLWKRNFPGLSEERYSWIYEGNLYSSVVCFLVKETEHDRVIGAATLFPRRIVVNGKIYLSAIAGDFVVDINHRGLGPALLLQKAAVLSCSRGTFAMLYGFPNKKSETVLLKAGYKVLGDCLRMTKPLRSEYYLQKHIKTSAIRKALSKPVDLTAKVMSKESYYRHNRKYAVETPLFFDERFDELWGKVSTLVPVIGERSSSYLNWRFKRSPQHDYFVFALTLKENASLLGYIVYSVADNKIAIADLLSIDMDKTFDSLLAEFLISQRKKGISSVSLNYMGTHLLIDKLKEYGFSIREKINKVLFFTSPESPFQSRLSDKENWYLLPGDNDI